MRILKDNEILKNYVIPILLFPISCLVIRYIISLIFQLGTLYGTFIRGLWELVLHNI